MLHGIQSDMWIMDEYEMQEMLPSRGHRIRTLLGPLAEPFAYCCLEEFAFEFGRAYRQMYKFPKIPKGMRRGNCFSNARALTRWSRGELTYAEGFCGANGVHHAWCVDIHGCVVDPTDDVSHSGPYFGITVPDFASRIAAIYDGPLWPSIAAVGGVYHPNVQIGGIISLASRPDGMVSDIPFGPWLTEDYVGKVSDQFRGRK